MATEFTEVGFTFTGDDQSAGDTFARLLGLAGDTEDRLRALNQVQAFSSFNEEVDGAENALREFQITADTDPEILRAFEEMAGGARMAAGDIVLLPNVLEEASDEGRKFGETLKGAFALVKPDLGPFIDNLGDIAAGLGNIADTAHEVADVLVNASLESIESFANLGAQLEGFALSGFFGLEQQATRFNAQIGESTRLGGDFMDSALSMGESLGVSSDAMGDLIYAMRSAGMEFGHTGDKISETDKTLGLMVGTLGVSVDDAVQFARSARLMGTSVTDLADDITIFQDVYDMPDMLGQLPAITASVVKMQARFGSSTVKASRETSLAVARMAGTFQRSLGMTAVQATQAAMEQFEAFAGETRAFKDVFLGLSDDFSPLQTAFLETGVGIDEMGSLMEKSQTDVGGFVDEVMRIRNSLDPQMGERFFQQVLRNAPAAAQEMLAFENQLQGMTVEERRAAEEQMAERRAAQAQTEEFNQLVGNMRGNVVDLMLKFRDLFAAITKKIGIKEFVGPLKSGLDDLIFLIEGGLKPNMKDLKERFGAQAGAISNVVTHIRAFVGQVQDAYTWVKEWVGGNKEFTQKLGLVAAGAIGVSTAIGSIGAVLGPVMLGLTPVLNLVSGLVGALWKFGRNALAAGKGVSGLRVLGAIFRKVALPIGVVMSLFDGFKDRIGNISDAIQEGDWDKAMDQVLGGLWDSFNSFFLGLPDKFMQGFRNVGQKVETEGSEEFGKSIGHLLGRALQTMVEWFQNDVKPWFLSINWTDDVLLPTLSGFAAVGEHILAFFKGVTLGILEGFGVSEERAAATWDLMTAKVRLMAAQTTETVQTMINTIKIAWATYDRWQQQRALREVEREQLKSLRLKAAWETAWWGWKGIIWEVAADTVEAVTSAVDKLMASFQLMVVGARPFLDRIFGEERVDAFNAALASTREEVTGIGETLEREARGHQQTAQFRVRSAREEVENQKAEFERQRQQIDREYLGVVGEAGRDLADATVDTARAQLDLARAQGLYGQLLARDQERARLAEAQRADTQAFAAAVSDTAAVEGGTGGNMMKLIADTVAERHQLLTELSALSRQGQQAISGLIKQGAVTPSTIEAVRANFAAQKQEIVVRLAATGASSDLIRRAMSEQEITATTGRTRGPTQ